MGFVEGIKSAVSYLSHNGRKDEDYSLCCFTHRGEEVVIKGNVRLDNLYSGGNLIVTVPSTHYMWARAFTESHIGPGLLSRERELKNQPNGHRSFELELSEYEALASLGKVKGLTIAKKNGNNEREGPRTYFSEGERYKIPQELKDKWKHLGRKKRWQKALPEHFCKN